MSAEYPKHPFLLHVDEVVATLGVNIEKGLSPEQVNEAQEKYPPNEFEVSKSITWYIILSKQVFNAMILVLIFAMGLSFGIGDYIEGVVLAIVVVVNVTIGFYQEFRAEKRMDALRALSSPSATVLRDGKTQVVPNAQVVPGDIVLLKMGDTVPADLRIYEAMNLSCDEQSLTGESVPADKSIEADILVPGSDQIATSADQVGVGDRLNIAYATTIVRKGRGRGIVVFTGMKTAVGEIAASTTKRKRKPGRSLNYKKYGMKQPFVGASKRTWDAIGKFLGLTEGTPLQRKLAALAYYLFGCAVILAIIVFGAHHFVLTGEVVIYAVSLGIAIIPESLVAVLTITMVVAVTVMRKANVVVRDLSALEALGGVTNICSDKTGTLTQGAMIVRKAWLPMNHTYTVHDSRSPSDPTQGRVGYAATMEVDEKEDDSRCDYDRERSAATLRFDLPEPKEKIPLPATAPEVDAVLTPALRAFLLSAALCNLATVRYDREESEWQVTGEPTEIALQVFAHRFELGKKSLEREGWKQVGEFPFDSSIKRMSVVYNAPQGGASQVFPNDRSVVFTKGAVERILDLCSHLGFGTSSQVLTDELREEVLKQMNHLASQGQRVLGIAYREWEKGRFVMPHSYGGSGSDSDIAIRAEVEQGLTLLGLAGIYDPPRRETKASIAECATAGIRVHMLTGDHPETAKAIAKEVGIIPRNMGIWPEAVARAAVLKATDFDRMTKEEIDRLPELPLVIARCAPETKSRMIDALRRRHAFMAMTGDGVNDAPSLARADVGIAMGSGSDVAKGASKIVLTDDQFNSIVSAIRQGRRMFDNIQKFILHLLTSNVGEVILLVAGLGFRDSTGLAVFPISPLEVLWINMVTSSFPAFGLGREEAAPDVMRRPPHDKKRGIFTDQIIVDMLVYGTMMGGLTMVSFCIVIWGANDGRLGVECNKTYSDACIPVFRARACVFAELTWMILLSAWEFKSLRRSVFRLDPDDESRFPLFKDLYSNRFLFWAVIIGGLSVFPAVYLPYVSTELFKHTGISWEWAVSVAFTLLFVVGIEAWKFVKRRLQLLQQTPVRHDEIFNQGEEGLGPSFKKSMTFSSFKEWASFSLKDSTNGFRSRSRSRSRPLPQQPDGDSSGAPDGLDGGVNATRAV
ncbi:calcium-transporting ATPase [Sodiomyces alkalinus F11]|uniref:P-type Na(+) transporter n=1 Tax=Sodiomyces alkalinus (strain CBS 110278 / VKM F-3762 / F11) TaxID=1314773 RepID=A0A3N2PX36_SODAK|nr:calcium-transporting ATPase [Sodiomyces alkalinus F11]ROT39093.1 calcium-transporting ATPase [Sodiomyces alkalinus F11]